jgi:alpha-L-rhamnosidase
MSPADQLENGSVPFVIPNVLGPNAAGSTGWADVCAIIPWNMYLAYGDKRILEQQYPSMKKWVEFMKSKSTDDLWNTGFILAIGFSTALMMIVTGSRR